MYAKINRNARNGEDPQTPVSSLCPSEKYLDTPLIYASLGGTQGLEKPTPHAHSTSGVMEREILYATCALTQRILLPCLP